MTEYTTGSLLCLHAVYIYIGCMVWPAGHSLLLDRKVQPGPKQPEKSQSLRRNTFKSSRNRRAGDIGTLSLSILTLPWAGPD